MGPTPKTKHGTTSENEKSVVLAGSPRKKEGKRPNLKDMKGSFIRAGSKNPSLLCYSFGDEFSLEAYLFVKDDYTDAFMNGYLKYANLKLTVDTLAEAGFINMVDRRVPHSKQDKEDPKSSTMKSPGSPYPRRVIMRYVPDGTSTPESRTEGLAILKTFLMSPNNTEFPPQDIMTIDCTNEASPESLDTFFLDAEIIAIVKQDVVEAEWSKIYSYKGFAPRLWSGNNYPEEAAEFGFP